MNWSKSDGYSRQMPPIMYVNDEPILQNAAFGEIKCKKLRENSNILKDFSWH